MPLLKSLKKKLGKKEKSDKASTRPESISKKPQPIPKHRLSQSYDITPSALPAPLPSPLPLKQTSSATGPASITTAHRSSLSQSSAASPVGYQTPPSPHSPYRSPAPSSPRSPEFSTLFVQDQSRRYQPSDQLLDQLVTSYTAASKAPEPVPPSPAEDVASMAMLPVELLEQIFLYSMPSTTSSRRTEFNRKSEPLNLTYVCSRWRAILLSRPKLWSSLVVISPQNRGISNLIRAWLSRSGDEPLHLALSASRSSPVVLDIVSQMVAHADRWKSIYFSLDFAGMPPVGSLLSMPLLESVDVEISAEQDCQFINRLWEGLAESTSLRTVHIIGHCAPPRPVYWPNVVDLDLDGMAWDLCLQILAGCPNVESLVLNQLNAPLTPTLALSHRPDAQLSKLTNLRFRTMRSLRKPLYDMNIIDHLTTPSLINLALSAFNRPEMVEAIAGLILRSHARLEQFIIQYDLLLVSTLTLLQQEYMQNLRVLRLVHLPISREVLWGLSDTVTYIPGAGGGGAATGLQPKHLKGLEEIQLAVKTKPDDNLGRLVSSFIGPRLGTLSSFKVTMFKDDLACSLTDIIESLGSSLAGNSTVVTRLLRETHDASTKSGVDMGQVQSAVGEAIYFKVLDALEPLETEDDPFFFKVQLGQVMRIGPYYWNAHPNPVEHLMQLLPTPTDPPEFPRPSRCLVDLMNSQFCLFLFASADDADRFKRSWEDAGAAKIVESLHVKVVAWKESERKALREGIARGILKSLNLKMG